MKPVAKSASNNTIDMIRTLTFWTLLILTGISTGQAMAAEVVISQTEGSDRLGGNLPLGQSFYASKTGLLKSIDVVGANSFVANLRVYSGNGTGGTVLHEQTFTVPQTHTSGTNYTFTTLVLDEDVPITKNQRYTFAFYSVVSGSVGLLAKDGNPYSGGEFVNNNGFTADMTFRVVQADDLPAVTLSVGTTTIDEDGGTASITATLDETFTEDVTVNLGFSGTATSGNDYASPSTTITIPAGDTSANASTGITASADTIHEGNETIIIDITGATNAEEDGTQQQTITITDDDSAPTVTLSTGTASIGEDGGSSTITATLSNPSSSAVTVNLSYSGTATSGTDYSTPSSSITVPAGQTTANAATGVTATGDVIYEGNETVTIDVSGVTNGTENGTQQQTITINDAESPPTVTLSASTSSLAEAAASSTLTATLSTAASENVTVNLAYSGTASNGTDYGTGPTSITVTAGQTTGTATLTATQDAITEDNETIIVDISSVSGGSASENGTQQQTLTIIDDDNTPPTLTTFATVIDSTNEDTAVEITFAELAAQGNEADAEGAVAAFVVKAVSTGSLSINGSAFATGTNDQITASKSASWTPADNANGTLNAFTVVALDGDDAESTPPVTAQISVTAVNDVPTLTSFSGVVDSTNEDTAVEITFAELAAQGNEADTEGAVAAFVVKAVSTGSLSINGAAFATGTNDQITSSKSASWTPADNANGTLNAFTVVALDGDDAESTPAVTAQVSVASVNDLPTLTSFGAVLDSTNEDTAVEITFAELAAQGNEADTEGAVSAFVVKAVSTGSLSINGSAFATGTNDQITSSKSASWTPADNANGTLNAFTVVALDGDDAESTPPVTAQISVTAVNDVPTLTSFSGVVDSTNEDTAVEITFAELAAQGNEADTEGAVAAFVVKAVSTGSLSINGAAFATGTNDQITSSKSASWTPVDNANGTLNAFTVVALDGENAESTPAVTAQVSVASVNDVPVLTEFSSVIDSTSEDTSVAITLAELNAQGDEADSDGTVEGYTVKSVVSGTLQINGSVFAAGTNDRITASKSATWAPATNANGTLDAFTVVALDNSNGESSTPIAAKIQVAPVNDAPTLSSFSTVVATIDEDSTASIDFTSLSASSDADDAEGIGAFVVKSVAHGKLTINGSDYVAGSNDQITASSTASWTPDKNINGLLDAFTVVVRDSDDVESSSAATAQIDVKAINDLPTFSNSSSVIGSTKEDTTVQLSFAQLSTHSNATDAEGEVAAFVVQAVPTGTLIINGSAYSAGDNDQISAASSLTWTPIKNATGDMISAILVAAVDSDGAMSATPFTARISVSPVNDNPTIAVNAGLSVTEGATAFISKAILNAADPDDTGIELTYSLLRQPTLGQLQLTNNMGVAINSFTQADIDNSRLKYVSTGGNGPDSFDVRLSDGGEDQSSSVTGTVQITVSASNQTTEISDNRHSDEVINNPVITSSGVLNGGSVSGTVQNDGVLQDVTVNDSATVNGGTLQGTIENRGVIDSATVAEDAALQGGLLRGSIINSGEISDVSLAADASIIGGVLTGQVIGDPERSAHIQAQIGPGAFIDNAIIGSGSQVDIDAQLGSNVLFESAATVPPGMSLTPLFSAIPWATEPEQVQTVNLQETLFTATGEESGTSLLEGIAQLEQVSTEGITASQNIQNGEFTLSNQDFSSTLLPVSVQQADFNAVPGVSVTEDGDVAVTTSTQQFITAYPTLNDEAAMRLGLGDLTMEFDDRANLIIGLPDAETTYVARPELIAVPADQGATPGLRFAPREKPANTVGAVLVYQDANGQLMQQSVPPVPLDWIALKGSLSKTEGVENVRIGSDGVIQLTLDGATIHAIAEYDVTKSSSPTNESDSPRITLVDDLNGDGIDDALMTFANNYVQTLYLYP